MKNILQGIKSRCTNTEEWINKLEDGRMKSNQSEQQKEFKNKNLWDNSRHSNIHTTRTPREKRETSILLKVMAENFPHLGNIH